MQHRVEGIVIRSIDYSEGSKIVTVLTDSQGKVGMIIRGAKKPRSRYGSLAQLLSHGEFVYFRQNGLGTLTHGDIVNSHQKLRENIELTAYAVYAAELTDKAIPDEEASNFLFRQLQSLLVALENDKDPEITVQLYEMKILELTGYAPDFSACFHCGNVVGPMALSAFNGGILCQKCTYRDPYALVLSDGALKILRIYRQHDLTRLGNVTVSEPTKALLKKAMRRLIDTQLQLQLKSRSFLDQLERFADIEIKKSIE